MRSVESVELQYADSMMSSVLRLLLLAVVLCSPAVSSFADHTVKDHSALTSGGRGGRVGAAKGGNDDSLMGDR